jgi:sortase A
VVAAEKTGRTVTSVEAPAERDVVADALDEPVPDGPEDTAAATPARAVRRPAAPAGLVLGVAVLCGLAVWFLLYALVLTGLQEHSTQSRLYEQYRLRLSAATAPLGGLIKPGTPVALVSAPSGGLHDEVVVEGTTSGVLQSGPGHESDTPLPGQVGSSVILGRSVTFGGPFRHITGLKVGDTIRVTTGQGVFSFQVYDVRHAGDPIKPLQAGKAGLTLVTSASSGWRSGWAPDRTVYVDAVQVHGTAQPAPQGRPTSISQASRPMQGESKGLVALIFWLEGLAVAGAAFCWSWLRWGRTQTWIVGVPVVLVMLWGLSGTLMRFLPNLL